MAVPKQHRSKSRQGQARMHKYLKAVEVVLCLRCKQQVRSHTVCENCGTYKGREIKDVLSELTKKERKQKEKELATEKPSDTVTDKQTAKDPLAALQNLPKSK